MTRWARGWLAAILAIAATMLLVGHRYVPNRPGNLGSLLETFLPWIGLSIPVLALLAVWRRSWPAAIATSVTAAVWLAMFGHLLVPGKGGGTPALRVISHNIGASNPDPARAARLLLERDADLIALQELTPQALAATREVLAGRYPHHVSRGTIALFSRHRLTGTGNVDVGMGWTRALRTQAQTPAGAIAVYVAHLASVRIGTEGFSSDQRDRTIGELGAAIAGEKLDRVILMGDLNGTAYDRSLAPLTFGLSSAHAEGGWGFGFTWPAQFPTARIDHILLRGIAATDAKVLPGTGSDHRPVQADLTLR